MTEGNRFAISLPAYLYALAKFLENARIARAFATLFLDVSASRIVDLASGLGGYTPLLRENENEKYM